VLFRSVAQPGRVPLGQGRHIQDAPPGSLCSRLLRTPQGPEADSSDAEDFPEADGSLDGGVASHLDDSDAEDESEA